MIRQILLAAVTLRFIAFPLSATEPRAKASDYPAHAESGTLSIGAEYLVHSISDGHQSFFLPNYLVVDTAVYPHGTLLINEGHFSLRMNGSIILPLQAPNMVSYALQNTATEDPSFNNGGNSAPRFPGDRRPPQPQPQSGADSDTSVYQPQPANVVAVRSALPEGEFHSPQGGFLYFLYSGKTKKIKSLDLLYNGPAGELVVKLF